MVNIWSRIGPGNFTLFCERHCYFQYVVMLNCVCPAPTIKFNIHKLLSVSFLITPVHLLYHFLSQTHTCWTGVTDSQVSVQDYREVNIFFSFVAVNGPGIESRILKNKDYIWIFKIFFHFKETGTIIEI